MKTVAKPTVSLPCTPPSPWGLQPRGDALRVSALQCATSRCTTYVTTTSAGIAARSLAAASIKASATRRLCPVSTPRGPGVAEPHGPGTACPPRPGPPCWTGLLPYPLATSPCLVPPGKECLEGLAGGLQPRGTFTARGPTRYCRGFFELPPSWGRRRLSWSRWVHRKSRLGLGPLARSAGTHLTRRGSRPQGPRMGHRQGSE